MNDPMNTTSPESTSRDTVWRTAVLRGAGHAVQSAPGFNETLVAFLERA